MKKLLILILLIGITAIFILSALFYTGTLRFNYPNSTEFPIKGIDISHHQGEIDWEAISNDEIQFAFIKATEGGDHKDKRFEENWKAAKENGIIPSAYHFYSFCKSGTEQAANIISSAPKESGTLPPAIDLEYSGNCEDRPNKAEFIKELAILSDSIFSHYGVRPILYSTPTFYTEYMEGEMLDHFLWARSIFGQPNMSDDRDWQFWQYTNKGEVAGINGPVDLNVFRGDRNDLEHILLQ